MDRTADDAISKTRARLALGLILLIGLLVRLVGAVPPGIHVDEASNAWNAWCLLNNGLDEHADFFPLFYTGAFGDNRSSLFLYVLIPFQAIFGFGAFTTRLPAVAVGVASIALTYYVGRRLFDSRDVGLGAALAIAFTPWQVFSSRWGHESTLCPLLVLGPIAALIWARSPLTRDDRPVIAWRGFVAGFICGGACYGYAAVRLFLPVFLLLATVMIGRRWRQFVRQPNGWRWIGALAIGFAITFGPLVYTHLTDPRISARGAITWAWDASDPMSTRITKVVSRYPEHFSPRWLFITNGSEPTQGLPRGFGVMHWWEAPFLLIGIAVLLRNLRGSIGARVMVAAVVAYPAGDLLSGFDGPNTLHSLPGLPWLALTVGVGLAAALGWLASRIPAPRRARIATTAVVTLASVAITATVILLSRLDQMYNTDPQRWSVRTMDIAAAVEWLKPRLYACDAVFWTQTDTSFVYAPLLVYLREPTTDWFDHNVPVVRSDSIGDRFRGANLVWQYGKHHFLFTDQYVRPVLTELTARGRRPRVAFIVRPGELQLDKQYKPTAEIYEPDGKVKFQCFDIQY